MTLNEYEAIQGKLSEKLNSSQSKFSGNRLEGYEIGLKLAKSILHEFSPDLSKDESCKSVEEKVSTYWRHRCLKAESCIDDVDDSLDRSNRGCWAQSIIDDWRRGVN